MSLFSTIFVAVYKMLGSKAQERNDDDSFVVMDEVEKLEKINLSIIRIESLESLENWFEILT